MTRQRISANTIFLTSLLTSLLTLNFVLPVVAQTKSSTKVAPKPRAATQLKMASEALQQHDAKQAFRLASEVIAADPENASAYFIRGKARAEYDDSKNALVDFSIGMKLDANSADSQVFLTMAQTYLQLKQPERALQTLQIGNSRKPTLELYKMSAGINSSLGHDKEALQDVEKALKFDPSSRTMILLRGSMYDHSQDFEHAIKDYSRVIELSISGKRQDTNWVDATKRRASDYDKVGKKDLARIDRETLNKEGASWEKDLF